MRNFVNPSIGYRVPINNASFAYLVVVKDAKLAVPGCKKDAKACIATFLVKGEENEEKLEN